MKFSAKTNSVDPLSFDIERLSFEKRESNPNFFQIIRLSWVATRVFSVRLLNAVAFSK